MGSAPIGFTACPNCRGTGESSNGVPCQHCDGKGVLVVYESPSPRIRSKWATGQRRFPRHLTNLPITVSLQGHYVAGYCDQIAEGGLGVLLPQIVPVGSAVSLKFTVPNPPTELRLEAVVRYQIGFQHGLEFVSLPEEARRVILHFCNELPSVSRE